MKRLSLFLFIMAAFVVNASSQTVTKEYNVKGFDALDARSAITVNYTVGKAVKVSAKGPKSHIDKLIVEVVDGELLCRYPGGANINGNYDVTVTVTGPALCSIEASSAASVNVLSTLNVDNLEIDATSAAAVNVKSVKAKNIELESSSAATITIAGSCADLDAEASSASVIDASGLTAARGDAEATSTGEIKLSRACKGKIATDTSSLGKISFK